MEKEAEKPNRIQIVKDYRRKTEYLLEKNKVEELELYDVSKEFFKKYLNVNYEATCKELINKVNTTYIPEHLEPSIKNYLDTLSVVEYKDSFMGDQQIKIMLEYFNTILKKLDEEPQKKSFWKSIFKRKNNV